MYGIKPKNYGNFKCIADKCTDTCCVGWEVEVDYDSAKKYSKDPYLKQYLEKINTNTSTKYRLKMDSESRCSFLAESGLCNMVLNRDDNYLCEVCKVYPRLKRVYGGNVFFTLTLSCEAAVSHLLKNEDDLTFEIEELTTDLNVNDRYLLAKNKFTKETNFEILNISMAILQNRGHQLYEKVAYLYMMYQNIDELEKSEDHLVNDTNVDTLLSQYLENLQNDELFNVIKQVKLADANKIFNVGNIIKALDCYLFDLRTMLHSANPKTAEKIKNAKNLIEYSDDEITNYSHKLSKFIKNNELILEKFIILFSIDSVFPSTFEKLEDAMNFILIRMFIIQTTIISLNIESESEVTEEMFFESIRLISKSLEHNKSNLTKLTDFVVNEKPNFKILMNIIF